LAGLPAATETGIQQHIERHVTANGYRPLGSFESSGYPDVIYEEQLETKLGL
jgi:hypothetical protein